MSNIYQSLTAPFSPESNNPSHRDTLFRATLLLMFYSFVTAIFIIVFVITIYGKNVGTIVTVSVLSLMLITLVLKCRSSVHEHLARQQDTARLNELVSTHNNNRVMRHQARVAAAVTASGLTMEDISSLEVINYDLLSEKYSTNADESGYIVPANETTTETTTTNNSKSQLSCYYDKQCSICLFEYFDTDRLMILPCLHAYHEHCARTWLQSKRTCPICVKEVFVAQSCSSAPPTVIDVETAMSSSTIFTDVYAQSSVTASLEAAEESQAQSTSLNQQQQQQQSEEKNETEPVNISVSSSSSSSREHSTLHSSNV